VRTIRLAVYLVVGLVQISVPASMMWKQHRTLSEGREWKFRTAPVDPVDVIRGRYLRLRFTAEEFARSEALPYTERAYAVLKNDAEGFAVVDRLQAEPISGDDDVNVRTYGWDAGKQRIRLSFDELWVTEADATAAEAGYVEHSRERSSDAYATVRVRKGHAAIEQLYIAGQPLHEFLRTHPPK